MKRRSFLKLTATGALGKPVRGLLAERAQSLVPEPSSGLQLPLAAKVKPHNNRPTLFINGEPVDPMFYALTDCPGGRWSWEEVPRWNTGNFSKAGIRLFQVDLFLEFFWPQQGAGSIGLARKQVRGVLDVCPDAAVFIRLHLNAPRWWNEENRQECVEFCDGPVDCHDVRHMQRIIANDLNRSLRPSLASQKWRQAASEKVVWFCQQLAASPEGAHVVGIQMACGVYGEWHYWGFIRHDPDTCRPMASFYRRWLREKYGTEAALQAAWSKAAVSFENASIPGLQERNHTLAGIFRDPKKERRVIDYYECQHHVVADDIIHFCRLAKQSWPRPLVTGTFYGYFFTLFGREAAGGHLAVEEVLNSPDVDYLSGPLAYDKVGRAMGGSGQSRGLVESCNLHGKLWLDEMDERPSYRIDLDAHVRGSLSDSIAILRRNLTQSYTHGQGLWFYDFGWYDTSGWWDAPELQAEISAIHKILQIRFKERFHSAADVLYVYDTDCFYYLAATPQGDPLTGQYAVDQASAAAYHSGAAVAMVHLGDLERVNWEQYRAVIFANTFLLNSSQRSYIRRVVAQRGRHLIWIYAPAYTDGFVLNGDFINEVTGMNVKPAALKLPPRIHTQGLGLPQAAWGINARIEPLFVVQDDTAAPAGRLEETGQVALARKSFRGSTMWFSTLPITRPEILRFIFKSAGTHIYTDSGDVIYSGGGLLVVHSLTGGERSLLLRNGKEIKTVLEPRTTVLFDSETGLELLS